MIKFISIIISLLIPTSLYGTTVSRENVRLSAVNGAAFIDFSSAGTLTPYVGYKLTLTDTSGRTLVGYIKSSGEGETYGAEILSNPGFDSATTSWNATRCTLASVTGGDLGNCLEVLATGTAAQSASQNLGSTGAHARKLLRYGGKVKSGTSGNEAFYFGFYPGAGSNITSNGGISSGSWVEYNAYGVAAATGTATFQISKNSSTLSTMLFDTVSVRQVLTPSATGVTIVSTPGGTIYNWATETSGFNFNDSSYDYALTAMYGLVVSGNNNTLSYGLVDCADTADMGGMLVTGTGNTIRNYTVARCPGGAFQFDESATLVNSIGVSSGPDITIAATKTVTAKNNIFGDAAKSGDGTYSDTGATTQWSTDPVFVNPSAGDFRLQSTSPAIDAGTRD